MIVLGLGWPLLIFGLLLLLVVGRVDETEHFSPHLQQARAGLHTLMPADRELAEE